jgi:hypothetical protein
MSFHAILNNIFEFKRFLFLNANSAQGSGLFAQLDSALCGLDGADGSVGVEEEAVYADFAMHAWVFVSFYVVFVDAVVDDVPFVGVRYLKDRVVGGSVDLALVVLAQDDGVFRHLDGSQW